MEINNKRIQWIDYLKAFACFLVVLGHLIQSLQKCDIDNFENITTFINWFIYLFHMPLFMCMSGFLYCKTKKEFSWENYKKFEFKKIVNLLVPYVTFYLIYIGINMMFANSVNKVKGIDDLIGIFNKPIAPYWFLYALLSIFILIPILEKICKDNQKIVFGILIILKIVSIFGKTNIYFIDSFMRYGIYFYFGHFINVESKKNKILNVLISLMYIILSLILYIFKNNINNYVYEIINVFMAIAGIYVCIMLFRNIKKSLILDTFKNYTFQIYLLHTIFAAGVRIILLKIGIENYIIHFILGIIASIYIPVFIAILSEKIKYTNFFFYPLKTIKELRERN